MANDEDKTTIKITDNLLVDLRVIGAELELDRNELVQLLKDEFEKNRPFRRETEFRDFFKKHLALFGYKKIITDNVIGYPDFILEKANGKTERVELEMVATNFIKHKHNPDGVDKVIAVYGSEKELLGIPVISFMGDGEDEKETTIQVSKKLRQELKIIAAQRNISIKQLIENLKEGGKDDGNGN